MAKGLVNESSLNSIAEAINVLNGTEDTYLPSEMGAAILDAIPTEEVTDDIVSVTDAAAYPAEGLEFAIEPVQDLHGYDRPWPAGGGDNQFVFPYVATGTFTDQGVTFTILDDGKISVDGIATGTAQWNLYGVNWDMLKPLKNNTTYTISSTTKNGTTVICYVYKDGNPFEEITARYNTTAQVVIPNDSSEYRMRLIVRVTSGITVSDDLIAPMMVVGTTAATSYKPYANICPISGWTGVNGERTGVNVWDEEVESGYINANGSYAVDTNALRSKNFCSCVGGKTYYFVKPSTYTTTPNICWYDLDKNFILRSTTSEFQAIQAPSNARYFKVSMWGYGSTYNHDISINYPATDTEYHTYTGTSIPITFPTETGTVYGGKVDVANGKLTVNYASVDLGALNWNRDTTTRPADGATIHAFYATLNDCKIVDTYAIPKMMSSSFTVDSVRIVDYGGYENIKDNICSGADNNHRIWIYGSIYNDLSSADFKAAMQGVQLVYELATPIEYDITPQQVQMLLGDNNVWCDTGDTTLEYKVDLGRYIDKKKSQQSASTLSTSPLSLGKSAAVLTDGADADEIEEVDEPVLYDEVKASEEAEELPVEDVKSVDVAEGEPAELPVEEDTEAEPTESEIWVKEPDAEEVIYNPINVTEPIDEREEGGDSD